VICLESFSFLRLVAQVPLLINQLFGHLLCEQAEPREGPFEQISTGAKYTCGIKVDINDTSRKKLECWGIDGIGMVSAKFPLQTIFINSRFFSIESSLEQNT
jgi:hypothetical protein